MSFKQYLIQKAIDFQIEQELPLCENTFRTGTENWSLYWLNLKENKDRYKLSDFDKELLETDIGTKAIYEDKEVLLDYPYYEYEFITEAEKDGKNVELNQPKRGGNKKFYVYVKNDKGNIIKVEFGDTSGLQVKINDPAARKSFAARHQCELKKDKTTPGYWACRTPQFAKQLGLEGGGNYWW